MIAEFSANQAQQAYDAETLRNTRWGGATRVQTHHSALRIAKRFFRWAVEHNYIGKNPFGLVKAIGKPNKGKEQLRIDESRQLTELLISEAGKGANIAIALLTQLLLGLRNSEVLARTARDLDDGGRVLWIPTGKTENARRRLDVPEVLRPFLLGLAKGRPADALLFPGVHGRRHYQIWLYRNLRRYCVQAGLQSVCPHSLRAVGDASELLERVLTLPPDALEALRRALEAKKAS